MMVTPTTIGAVPAVAADRPGALEAVRTPRLQLRHGPWIGMPIVHRLRGKVGAAPLGISR